MTRDEERAAFLAQCKEDLGRMVQHFEALQPPQKPRKWPAVLAAVIVIALALHAAPKAWQQAQLDARETQE